MKHDIDRLAEVLCNVVPLKADRNAENWRWRYTEDAWRDINKRAVEAAFTDLAAHDAKDERAVHAALKKALRVRAQLTEAGV
jgi:hypothetical protein